MNRILNVSLLFLLLSGQLLASIDGYPGISNYGYGNKKTAEALANLEPLKNESGRADLARYLSYDTVGDNNSNKSSQKKDETFSDSDQNKALPVSSGSVESAVQPLSIMLKSLAPQNKIFQANAINLSEGLIRAGFGMPLRSISIDEVSQSPLQKKLTELARALRAARGNALLSKTHIELEEILADTQEYHYVLGALNRHFKQIIKDVATVEASLDPTEFTGQGGTILLALKQIAISSETSLTSVDESFKRKQQLLRHTFAILKSALATLDGAMDQAWSMADNKISMSDSPGTIKTVYSSIAQCINLISDQERISATTKERLKLNYRNCIACIVTSSTELSTNRHADRINEKEAEAIIMVSSLGTNALKEALSTIEKEQLTLKKQASYLKKDESASIDLPFPPLAVMLPEKNNSLHEAATDNEGPEKIIWNPAISVLPDSTTASEDLIATQRDLDLIDSLETAFSTNEGTMANEITAAFINARHRGIESDKL
jgi:hypothetical protein